MINQSPEKVTHCELCVIAFHPPNGPMKLALGYEWKSVTQSVQALVFQAAVSVSRMCV